MISPAEREERIAQARAAIGEGSKSFRFASRLFDRRTRERTWLLYAWCRACDDLADGQSFGHGATMVADPERRLAYLRQATDDALAGKKREDPAFDGLRILVAECSVSRRFIEDHLAGFALDSRGWRPETVNDLLAYCYHVAGAVGCLMAQLMGVPGDDEETLDRAADLGIAFQLANIARDLHEDDAVGRCYLPADWLKEMELSPGELLEAGNRPKLVILAGRLGRLASAFEASARIGAGRLPFRSRWAILSAARIYGAIARKVARRGEKAWEDRTFVTRSEKLGHVLAAAAEACRRPLPIGRSGLWTRPRP